ncbi:MAG: DEAD/DEAH box helicase [Corynebacteriales bacterium]|nr:DEAD/DEAH box helicase [Mycobacteriales bacterium]
MTLVSTPAPTAASAPPLRAWQRRALVQYLRDRPQDFMAVATPGAGKTAFALRIALELLADGVIQNITVVAPTEHLKTQWAQAAARIGIQLDPTFRNSDQVVAKGFHGIVVTYAQVGLDPTVHLRRTRTASTLVILDEIHHAGDSRTWGDGVRIAFNDATRRLALTGTPFRSDANPIPFVNYERGADGLTRSASDANYGYSEALRDGVVRPVLFMAYSGQARWRTSAGDELTARLGEPLTAEQTAQAWRTVLDPKGNWIPQVLRAANARLSTKRSQGVADAGGLVIASDHASARAYAQILHQITGEAPVVVLSDDAGASAKIQSYAAGDSRWMVAVRMVSEGVDIPRLAVGVYATSVQTPLFFAQAVGRFVRVRQPGETATIFVPSVPVLLDLAHELERERDHVLERPHREELLEDALLAAANREENEAEEQKFLALDASAELDQVIYDGASFGTLASPGTAEEEEYLGLPGLLSPEQVSMLLSKRQAEQLAARRTKNPVPAPAEPAEPVSLFERRTELRRKLNGFVASYSHRTGKPHKHIHAELRRACGGPATAQASVEELEQRIATLRTW